MDKFIGGEIKGSSFHDMSEDDLLDLVLRFNFNDEWASGVDDDIGLIKSGGNALYYIGYYAREYVRKHNKKFYNKYRLLIR